MVSEVLPFVVLRECMTFMHNWMNALLKTDQGKKGHLSPVACGILYVSYFHQVRMKDVSERFHISKSTATDYVNNLEKKGYVKRVRGENDRRDIYIVPDWAGEQWILERETDVFAFLEKRMSVFSPDERETFVRLLAKFTGYGEGEEHGDVLMKSVAEAAKPSGLECRKINGRYERVEDMVIRVYGDNEKDTGRHGLLED